MNATTSLRTPGRCKAGWAVAVAALASSSAPALAAWHDDHPGSGVAAHYVHLTGYQTDQETARRNLLISQEACVNTKHIFGQQAQLLSPETLPRILNDSDIEIYYSAERSLTVFRPRLHTVDPADCSWKVVTNHVNTITLADGACVIEVPLNIAKGACNGPLWPGVGQPSDLRPNGPLEMSSVAGMPCRVHREVTLSSESCLVELDSLKGVTPAPAKVRRATINGGRPGLLVRIHSIVSMIDADEVRLNLSVSPSLFALPPPGVKLMPGQGWQR